MKKDDAKIIALSIVSIVAVCFFIYGSYWVATNVSYAIFYEDMVKQTVVEMVDGKYLK